MRTKAKHGSQDPHEGARQPFRPVDWPGGLSWRQLASSSAMHLIGALGVLLISFLVIPEVFEPECGLAISFLSDPPIEEILPESPPEPPTAKPLPPPQLTPRPAAPEAVPSPIVKVPEPEPPVPVVPPAKPSAEVDPPAPPKREIRTDVFAQGSSAVPDSSAPARTVQTGGFGDPAGIPANGATRSPVARTSLGAFDLPAGPGRGNGTGGASGMPGAVVSAGFRDGVATSGAGTTPPARAAVRGAGFAEATAPAEAPRPKPRIEEPALLPVEIVFKPKPAYTEEARRLHVEGEVVLEVLFTAAGRSQVLRVVRGLGSGLDESATLAAEGIRFNPARRDGQPVDHTAVVRILFQLT